MPPETGQEEDTQWVEAQLQRLEAQLIAKIREKGGYTVAQGLSAMPPPLALTDEQLDHLFRLSRPLSPPDRSEFLETVAAKLSELPELGDGGRRTRRG